mgnify:CR=1 FL=1
MFSFISVFKMECHILKIYKYLLLLTLLVIGCYYLLEVHIYKSLTKSNNMNLIDVFKSNNTTYNLPNTLIERSASSFNASANTNFQLLLVRKLAINLVALEIFLDGPVSDDMKRITQLHQANLQWT